MLVDIVLAHVLEGIKQQETLHSCLATHPDLLIPLNLTAPYLGRVILGGIKIRAHRKYSCGGVIARNTPLQASSFGFSS